MDFRWAHKIGTMSLLACALAVSSPARGYVYRTCNGDKVTWESSTVTYRPMTISFPYGSSDRAALERSRYAWNSYSPSGRFRFSFSYTSDSHWVNGDGINDVAYTYDYGWGSGTLGVTITRYDACAWPFWDGSINETDVFFNPSVSWNKSTQPSPTSSGTSLALVAVHELGHALGLKHENRWMATMNSYYPNSGVLGSVYDPDPHADDTLADRYLYGAYGSTHDVALSIYRRTGTGTSGIIPRPIYAAKGYTKTLTFTISNRGNIHESYVLVRFYASTNNYISTADRYLGAAAYWMSPGFEGTVSVNVVIPTNLTTGYYYLGFLADPYNAIPETDEGNNRLAYTGPTYIY